MHLLSIIIPVYKVEKYIQGTLDSIYNQNYDESIFEVIVVNDGTPDDSMSIVDRFASCHSNLKIINQKNQGLSCARNAGLKIATGKYVWFVDSDDSIAEKSLNKICELAKNSDIEIFGFNVLKIQETSNEKKIEKPMLKKCIQYGRIYSGKQIAKWMHNGMVQRYVFSREFLEKNTLSFFPGIYYEDNEFMIRAIILSSKVLFADILTYRYLVRNQGSIMSEIKKKSLEDVCVIVANWKHFLNEKKDRSWISQFIYSNIFSQICWCIIVGSSSKKEDVSQFFQANKKNWKCMIFFSFIKSGKFLSVSKIKDLFKGLIA